MLPSVKKRVRNLEDELYSILHNEVLLHYEKVKLDSALRSLIDADYFLSHLKLSHTSALLKGF